MYPNLRAEIGRAGLTATSLGKKIGLSPSEMSRLMNGKKPINLDLAGRIKEAIGTQISLEELFEIKE